MKSANKSDLSIEFFNKSEIIFLSAQATESIRGYVVTGALIVDEAAYISEYTYEVAMQCTRVHKAPMFLFSTPFFTDGFFYKAYINGLNRVKHYYSFDWSDNKYDRSAFITDEQIEVYRQIYSQAKFTSEVLGEFITEGMTVFRNFRNCISEPEDKTPVFAGIDFGLGTEIDSTVITLMNKHGQVVAIHECDDAPPTEQVAWLANIINTHTMLKAVICEANSIGTVYLDFLKKACNNSFIIKDFTTTNKTKRDIIERLAAAFYNNKIGILDDYTLKLQLAHFSMKKTKSGGYTYENDSPTIHDDYVMSLAMCYEAFLTLDSLDNSPFGLFNKY